MTPEELAADRLAAYERASALRVFQRGRSALSLRHSPAASPSQKSAIALFAANLA